MLQKEYEKQYYLKHKEKIKKWKAAWYQENRIRLLQSNKKYVSENREKILLRRRKYQSGNRAVINAKRKSYPSYRGMSIADKIKFPEKHIARSMVRSAIRAGKMKRSPCEVCGIAKSHAHHEDYSKPLDVMWLCPLHHAAHHPRLFSIKGLKINK